MRNIKRIIKQMTLEEKASMCSGKDYWYLKGIERLGIPEVMVSDGPSGIRKQVQDSSQLGFGSIEAVCFPAACLTACSFDEHLLEKMGERIGEECRAENISVILGPSANIKRSPLCGRNFEYFSEDPYLGSHMAAAYVRGVQKKDVSACVKHFFANNQEYQRMTCSSDMDERTMREIYLNAFETIVKDGQPDTMMCSYNKINGTYVSENHEFLTKILRDEWGYKGYVMSDWSAVNNRVEAIRSGLDLAMPGEGGYMDEEIITAVRSGTLSEEIVDQAVERILNIIFKYVDSNQTGTFDKQLDHDLATKVATESMVLLKNDGVLPLPKKGKKIAFIGEFAKSPRYQGGGSANINSFKVVSALEAASDISEIIYAQGYETIEDRKNQELFDEAIDIASKADIAVVFVGLPEAFESEGYDREHMRMPNCQNELISSIAKVQKNTVVILHNGSPVEMPWADEVSAILEAYLGGEGVGTAEVSLLFGDANPCGKLAESFPLKLSDNPSYLFYHGNGKRTEYREGVFVGYRYYDSKKMNVRYPFGHGLSYTTFMYDNLQISKGEILDNEELKISFDVTNTGKMAGKETVQLYISDKTNLIERPEKELKNFVKVYLKPGEKKRIEMSLNKRSFAWYSTDIHDWYVGTGEYQIMVGSSSKDIRLVKNVRIVSTVNLPIEINRNTTIHELLNNSKTNSIMMSVIDKLVTYMNGVQKEGDTVKAEQLIKMLESSPLRLLHSLMGMSFEDIDKLIIQFQNTFKEDNSLN
ncbi:glycosyl hydrolase [Thomasclavelia ramosa]|jgi:beta-glucosidase|uniref:beta-glucosidase family protein n=1 Tax=Coprobacillaceae TaxID=2810280 RepID=UPI000E5177A4|nr:glycoside hydrolase family 3 C-terminal domain-containing protein [Thomasclavelia ramosa]RGX62730.1 glycosyl hydrolase [Thomasclavelia ramosa]